jgi:hypothetical protein
MVHQLVDIVFGILLASKNIGKNKRRLNLMVKDGTVR